MKALHFILTILFGIINHYFSSCRKQASLWIQGDIYRSREQERAEKGI